MARAVRVRANLAGVREVLKSPGVEAMLAAQARRAADRCNALYSSHPRDPRIPPYGSMGVQRKLTAGGLVFARTELGRKDNLRNNTLRKGCGI